MSRSHREAGNVRTAEYKIWTGIRTRCLNPNCASYRYYGGRGIGICTRWLKYENFLADMGRRPTPKHSIDRIDFNGSYIPENCRPATAEQQARNKQNIRPLTVDGVTQTLAEWAIVSGTPLKRIWERLTYGWLPSAAVFAPKRLDRPVRCHAGHLLAETARWEETRRRCTVCKKAYDAARRAEVKA